MWSKSIDIKINSKRLRVTASHTYKLSNGGYFHIAPIVLSFGSNGFGISLLGLYLGMSVNNLNIIKEYEDKPICPEVIGRSYYELEMLAEDLECIKMWLDNKNVPTHDDTNNQYSFIGRIELLLKSR